MSRCSSTGLNGWFPTAGTNGTQPKMRRSPTMLPRSVRAMWGRRSRSSSVCPPVNRNSMLFTWVLGPMPLSASCAASGGPRSSSASARAAGSERIASPHQSAGREAATAQCAAQPPAPGVLQLEPGSAGLGGLLVRAGADPERLVETGEHPRAEVSARGQRETLLRLLADGEHVEAQLLARGVAQSSGELADRDLGLVHAATLLIHQRIVR